MTLNSKVGMMTESFTPDLIVNLILFANMELTTYLKKERPTFWF